MIRRFWKRRDVAFVYHPAIEEWLAFEARRAREIEEIEKGQLPPSDTCPAKDETNLLEPSAKSRI